MDLWYNNICFTRRIKNEIKNIIYPTEIYFTDKELILLVLLDLYVIKIKITSNYPFTCPSYITINDIHIRKYHKYIIDNKRYIKELNDECICCNSLISNNNWCVNNNLTNLIDECKQIILYLKKIMEYEMLEKVIKYKTHISMPFMFEYL
jgi:hypothetical protein